jgi:hypothetical protein
VHPNARLLQAFYQAQAAFYAGGDDTAALRGLLADDIAWHVPGRSPIAGHYHGHQEVLGYFAARRARAKATFRVRSRAILADDGQLRTWPTASCAPGRLWGCFASPTARSPSAGWCPSTSTCSTNSGAEPSPGET